MKIVSYPDFGCGGIICSLLNNELLSFYNLGHTKSPSHSLLKKQSHEGEFDLEQFEKKMDENKSFTGWAGTHSHPNDFLELDGVEQVLYVKVEDAESKCLLSLRHLEYGQGLATPANMETLLAARWFWPNRWQVPVVSPKVTNVEIYKFYSDREYRRNLFDSLGIELDETKYSEWRLRNDYMRYMPDAMKLYSEMLTRKHEYMTV